MKEIRIVGGIFLMGSPLENRVTVDDFFMDETPVTQGLWKEVTGALPEKCSDLGADFPVTHVSWFDAINFCNARSVKAGFQPAYAIDGENVSPVPDANGYRLPTEAEWEYACRAGTTGPRYGDLDEIAVYNRDKIDQVRTKKPNAWGLYDMIGLVWEWCWDVYVPDRTPPVAPPKPATVAVSGPTAREIASAVVDELASRLRGSR